MDGGRPTVWVVPSDHEQIIDLLGRYCWALDTKRFDELHDVFLPDATARLGGSDQDGIDEIIERVSTALDRFEASQHLIGSYLIEIDGDTATSRCHLQAQHVWPEGHEPRHLMVGGKYEDRLVRTPDGWRIGYRLMRKIWTEER